MYPGGPKTIWKTASKRQANEEYDLESMLVLVLMEEEGEGSGLVLTYSTHRKSPSYTADTCIKKITINVPLFKKLRDIIFFCGTITL
jgi:hypothetical protein